MTAVGRKHGRPLLADSTYWLLLTDTGQWKIQSLTNVSLLEMRQLAQSATTGHCRNRRQ
jgi:hypothetical protein